MICVGKIQKITKKKQHRTQSFALELNINGRSSTLHSLFLDTHTHILCASAYFIRKRQSQGLNLVHTDGFVFLVLAIVPIEYFNERNGLNGNTNGTKIKSINEENRV